MIQNVKNQIFRTPTGTPQVCGFVGFLDTNNFANSLTDTYIVQDGTRLYIKQQRSALSYFDLATPFEVASAGAETFVKNTQFDGVGMQWNTDGTRMYDISSGFNDTIIRYGNGAIPFAEPVANLTGNTIDTGAAGMYMSRDEFTFYVAGATGDTLRRYDNSSFANIAVTTNSATVSLPDGSGGTLVNFSGVWMDLSETKLFITVGSSAYEYSMSIPKDITTLTYVRHVILDAAANVNGLSINDAGTRMYAAMNFGTDQRVGQYNLCTPNTLIGL